MDIPRDTLARDSDMIYSISDLLGMHSSIVAHFASQQGLPSPELGNSHHILRRTLSLALDYSYAVRADAVRLLHLLFIFILPKYLFSLSQDFHYRELLIAASAVGPL